MTDAPRLRSVQLDSLEQDVQTALNRQQIGAAVEHVNEQDVGRLSAEAVLAQYEAAATAVEGMGDEIKERIKRLEAALVEADKDMLLVKEAAAAIREKGKLVYVQIEEASSLSEGIRNACADFRKKVGA